MSDYKIDSFVRIGDEGQDIYVAQIKVRTFLLWHFVTEVSDEDPDYVMNRADEIISILENPNT